MSLRKRIQILLVFLVGVPLLVLLFESYQTGRTTLVTEMKRQARQIADLETAKMDLTFEPARLIVEGVVRALETDPQLEAADITRMCIRSWFPIRHPSDARDGWWVSPMWISTWIPC